MSLADFWFELCAAIIAAYIVLDDLGVGICSTRLPGKRTDHTGSCFAFSMTVSNASADHYTLTVMRVVAIIGIPFVLHYTAGCSTCSVGGSS